MGDRLLRLGTKYAGKQRVLGPRPACPAGRGTLSFGVLMLRNPQTRRAALLLATLAVAGPAGARTWRITPDGTGDAPTIQAGINSAQAGDIVLLAAGTYTWTSQGGSDGSMLHLAPGVTLRGESGAAATILDAETQGRLLSCVSVGSGLIEGLTFTNGRSSRTNDSQGGAIDVRGTSMPTIRGCTFRGNRTDDEVARGGAVFCEDATIEDCEFLENRAGVAGGSNGYGGAIWCGAAAIRRCTFSQNETLGHEATGGGAVRSSSATISDCTFTGNFIECPGLPGGGALVDRGNPTIERCVFRDNIAVAHYFSSDGGAARLGSGVVRDCVFIGNQAQCWIAGSRGGALMGNELTITGSVFIANAALQTRTPAPSYGGAVFAHFMSTIERSTFVANSAGTPDGVGAIELPEGGSVHGVVVSNSLGRVGGGAASWSCNVLFGNADSDAIVGIDAGANLRTDPLFCSDPTATGQVGVRTGSPCAGFGACGTIGAGEVACEATAVESSTWSAMKDRYRSR